jgi:hypothetical protein
MKKQLRKVLTLGLVLLLLSSISVSAYAHSGRTDGSGGHRDNQNKSGLGYYHYHHGYGPHLHPDGVCPYVTPSTDTSSSINTSNTTNTTNTGSATAQTYSHVHGRIPHFKVSVCGNEMNHSSAKYPMFVYNDITYIPLTWSMCNALGITSEFDETGLSLTSGQAKSTVFEPIVAEYTRESDEVDIVDSDMTIWIDGVQLKEDSDYPIKNYNGVTYIPLTWDMASKLGVEYTYSEDSGLDIQ